MYLSPLNPEFISRRMSLIFSSTMKDSKFIVWKIPEKEYTKVLQNSPPEEEPAEQDQDDEEVVIEEEAPSLRGGNVKLHVDVKPKKKKSRAKKLVSAIKRKSVKLVGGKTRVKGVSSYNPTIEESEDTTNLYTEDGLPSAKWIKNFWKFVDLNKREEVDLFAEWPLLPLTIATQVSKKQDMAIASPAQVSMVDYEERKEPEHEVSKVTRELMSLSLYEHAVMLPSIEQWPQSKVSVCACCLECFPSCLECFVQSLIISLRGAYACIAESRKCPA